MSGDNGDEFEVHVLLGGDGESDIHMSIETTGPLERMRIVLMLFVLATAVEQDPRRPLPDAETIAELVEEMLLDLTSGGLFGDWNVPSLRPLESDPIH